MRLALLASLAALALPATAAADDRSVWDAYAHAHRADLRQAVDAYSRAAGHPHRVRAAIAAGRRVSRTLGTIAAGVRAEAPSSDGGDRAKGLLLDSLDSWRRAMELDGRSLRLIGRGRLARGTAVGLRSNQALAHADRLEARAVRALRAAGVEL